MPIWRDIFFILFSEISFSLKAHKYLFFEKYFWIFLFRSGFYLQQMKSADTKSAVGPQPWSNASTYAKKRCEWFVVAFT
jgi:hypothetical protein